MLAEENLNKVAGAGPLVSEQMRQFLGDQAENAPVEVIVVPELAEEEGLWGTLEARLQALEEQAAPALDLWKLVETQVDPNLWKPKHLAGFEVVEDNTDPSGEKCYYLKCGAVRAYLKIGEKQLFIWNLMDGGHTVRDIMFAFFKEYGTMPIPLISKTVQTFAAMRMVEQPKSWVELVARASGEPTATRGAGARPNLVFSIMKTTYTLRNIDSKATWLYRQAGWLLFKPFIWLPLILVGLSGSILAAYNFFTEQPVTQKLGELGGTAYIVMSYLTLFPIMLFHETMHAMAVKHFKREVLGGGFLLLKGLPALFLDTTDMWMDRNKWHRVTVSLIGPLTNFVLAGLFSWIAWGLPPSIITVFFFALALNNILNGFLNLSPFIELDGYYALMDALGETALRAKSFKFIRQELPKRWRRFYKFSRQEWIYTVFGLIALVYTTAILGLVGFMLVKQIQSNPALVIGAVLLFILFTGQKHLTRLLNRSKGEPTGNNFDPAKLPPQVRAKIEKGPGNQGPSGATLSRQGR